MQKKDKMQRKMQVLFRVATMEKESDERNEMFFVLFAFVELVC